MTVREALSEGQHALKDHETDTPELDTSLMLAYARGGTRERLFMDLNEQLETIHQDLFRTMVSRRIDGEPVAWIIGVKGFWGLKYSVGPGVLCPRPDSEVMVETSLDFMDKINSRAKAGMLHDCCCGAGTLGIALAVERPDWTISASDISETAAGYFQRNNAELAGGRITYISSDLMEDIHGPFDIIISNPPYLTPKETKDRTARGWKEPVSALNGGGQDGLQVIRQLIPRAAKRLQKGGYLLLEASPLQMKKIHTILSDNGFDSIGVRRDLADRERVIYGRRMGHYESH